MANKQYINPEAITTWTDSGGDKLMDMGGLAAGAIVMGAFLDLGVAPRSEIFGFEVLIDGFDTVPVVSEQGILYFAESIATTNFDGNPTTDPTASAEGTITEAQLVNILGPIGFLTVYSTTAADELKIGGIVRLPRRYVAPVIHNNTADAFLSSSDAHTVKLWAIPPEMQ